MVSPLKFLSDFRQRLHAAGIRFALTSGQACVHFGIQQTTKDSDWIIAPEDIGRLRDLLVQMDLSEDYKVVWRPICGAPCQEVFLGNGWTSHLAVIDKDSNEHHLDFFGKAPRVNVVEHDPDEPDIASRFVVAQMKKTDREKDWPFVSALARQSKASGDVRSIQHGQDADWLIEAWTQIPEEDRSSFIDQRPLLQLISSHPDRLRRAIMIEKHIWQTVNRSRYQAFQGPWKDFYRKWRREPGFHWPSGDCFEHQCRILETAAEKYELPVAPFSDLLRTAALTSARKDAADIFAATDEEINQIAPPIEVLMP